jgi:hypothetical protein
LSENNKSLKKEIEELKVNLSISDKKLKSLENIFQSQLSENESLKKDFEIVKNKNKELLETINKSGLEANRDYSLILNNEEFIGSVPNIYFDGKLSIMSYDIYNVRELPKIKVEEP